MYEERQRLMDRLAIYETMDTEFQHELGEIMARVASKYEIEVNEVKDNLLARVRRILEKFLLSRGEAFAAAVTTGDFHQMGFDELQEIIIRDIGEHPDSAKIGACLTDIVADVIRKMIELPSETAQHYLRSLSDAYTLLAFLRETPDVQSAFTKMFSGGEIWLDTSVILPLFAEDLLEPENQRFTNLFRAASEAGLRLNITNGVLEEVERHMNLCCVCHRTSSQEWVGRVPFLYSLYALSGRSIGEFESWVERFRGSARPVDDIADYLQLILGIEIRSLEVEEHEAPDELRIAVQEIWNEIQIERRRNDREADPMMLQRLAAHDVENYLGVIVRRSGERESPFGYNSWWLTLDRDAFTVKSKLRDFVTGRVPDSPVLSPDFLANYLAFGPIRRQVSKSSELSLPVVIDLSVTQYLPQELVALAESVREELKGCPEYMIRRKVRDRLDAAKARRGAMAQGGTKAMQQDLTDKVRQVTAAPQSAQES